jgi:hypothetical protein
MNTDPKHRDSESITLTDSFFEDPVSLSVFSLCSTTWATPHLSIFFQFLATTTLDPVPCQMNTDPKYWDSESTTLIDSFF